MPTRKEVYDALKSRLEDMKVNGPAPDVFTFAGNGEPTSHPDFAGIIDDTIDLRNEFFPNAKVSVLTNGTLITRQPVFDALMKVDNNIVKLDTVDADYIELIDRPTGKYDLPAIIQKMKEFGGHCIIQTMFMHGQYEGKDVSNLSDHYLLPWLQTVKEIAPSQVMIYTIDRETPAEGLKKATPEELDRIVELLEKEGLKASASY